MWKITVVDWYDCLRERWIDLTQWVQGGMRLFSQALFRQFKKLPTGSQHMPDLIEVEVDQDADSCRNSFSMYEATIRERPLSHASNTLLESLRDSMTTSLTKTVYIIYRIHLFNQHMSASLIHCWLTLLCCCLVPKSTTVAMDDTTTNTKTTTNSVNVMIHMLRFINHTWLSLGFVPASFDSSFHFSHIDIVFRV